jgi:hypothetical protein
MSKNFIFTVAAILAVTCLGTFVFLRPKVRAGVSINNMRPYPPEAYEQWHKEEARVYSIVPLASTFSNAVVALGGDYTAVTNGDVYWADFRSVLPGDTNVSDIVLRVQDDKIEWQPFAPPSLKFPPHKTDESNH